MKVVFRLSNLHNGGTEQVFLSLARLFVKDYKMSVHFVTDSSKGDIYRLNLMSGEFSVHSLEASSTFNSVFKFANYIASEQPDVIISAFTDTNAGAILSRVIARSNAKLLITEHASIKHHWKGKGVFRTIKNFIYFKIVYRFADHIVGVSRGLSDELENLVSGRVPISTIHNPIRLDLQTSDTPVGENRTKTILSVGRVTEQKDYVTLLKSLGEVRKSGTDFKALVVGGISDHHYFTTLQQIIAELNLSNCVEFLPFSDDIFKLYRQADVFVLSSAWEGFGNVIVEALSSGVPVVSTNCNFGPSEILQDGAYGVLVPVGDYKALAEGILQQLIKPVPNREQRVERSNCFSESAAAEKYYRLIEKLMLKDKS